MTSLDDCLIPVTDVPTGRARAHRVLNASEVSVPLPALVRRDHAPVAINLDQARRGLEAVIAGTGALTVDVETTGYPIGHQHYQLRTIQLGNEHTALVLDAQDPAMTELASQFLHQATYLIAYSAIADLVPLVHAGLISYDDAWERMYDVMLPAKLNDPNITGTDAGLKGTAAALLSEAVSPTAEAGRQALFAAGGWLTDIEITTPVTRNGWYQVDPSWARMVRYAASDVLDTAALVKVLPRTDPAVIHRERTIQRMTARITHDGLPLDRDHVMGLLDHHTHAKHTAGRTLRGLGLAEPGGSKAVVEALTGAGVVLPLTDKGKPSVEAPVLAKLRHTTGRAGELISSLLDYRHHATLLSTFLGPYQQVCDHGDGRVRPTVYTLSARTGRMSSVRPNAQNIPRVGGIRACITADLGYLLVSADLAGIEMRVAAALSGDTALTRMVVEGSAAEKTDLHWRVAQQVFGPDATKAQRYLVKPGVYGRFYGAGAETLAAEMGCTPDIAAAVIGTLDALTPDYTRWAAGLRAAVEAGRTRYGLHTGTELHLPRAFPHKAPNYVIQRTAREILVDALLRWRDTPWGASIVLPIHDEILTMVPTDEAHQASKTLVECMTTEFQGIPITAAGNEPSVAWADAA